MRKQEILFYLIECPIESQTAEVILVEKKLFVDWHIFSEEKPKKLLNLFAMWRIIKAWQRGTLTNWQVERRKDGDTKNRNQGSHQKSHLSSEEEVAHFLN